MINLDCIHIMTRGGIYSAQLFLYCTPCSLPCRAGAFSVAPLCPPLISRQWMTSLDLCLPSGQGSQPRRRQPALAGLASPRHHRREPKGHWLDFSTIMSRRRSWREYAVYTILSHQTAVTIFDVENLLLPQLGFDWEKIPHLGDTEPFNRCG